MLVIYIILVAANLFVSLACLCVFVFKLGMLGVFIAVLCDEAIRAVINFIRFLRIKF